MLLSLLRFHLNHQFIISCMMSKTAHYFEPQRKRNCTKQLKTVHPNLVPRSLTTFPNRQRSGYEIRCILLLMHIISAYLWMSVFSVKNGAASKTKIFCVLYDYPGKAGVSKGFWKPKRKLGVTTHLSEIINIIHSFVVCFCFFVCSLIIS